MRRQLILHLLCINLIAAAWIGVLIKIGKSHHAETASSHATNPEQAQSIHGVHTDIDPALVAEKAALETEVGDLLERVAMLQNSAETMSRRIQVPKDFFDAPAHFLSPFIEGDTADKFRDLLQMDDAETAAVGGAIDGATKAAREFESAELSIEMGPDGFPIYRVPAWGDFGDKLLGDLQDQLDGILGAERSAYYTEGYVIKEVLRKKNQELRIFARPGGGDRPYPSLQVRTIGPETGASGNGDYMVWLTGKNPQTGKFIERYGHLIGVDSAEELTTKVSALPN